MPTDDQAHFRHRHIPKLISCVRSSSDFTIIGGWWRWALVSPDGVVPSQMVDVSAASVNLPLHHKV